MYVWVDLRADGGVWKWQRSVDKEMGTGGEVWYPGQPTGSTDDYCAAMIGYKLYVLKGRSRQSVTFSVQHWLHTCFVRA